MEIQLSKADLQLLYSMMDEELGSVRVEIRHAAEYEYKEMLENREKRVRNLKYKIGKLLGLKVEKVQNI